MHKLYVFDVLIETVKAGVGCIDTNHRIKLRKQRYGKAVMIFQLPEEDLEKRKLLIYNQSAVSHSIYLLHGS